MEKKKWTLGTIVLYGINMVVGSGIFLLPGNAYKIMGPGSIFAYIGVLVLVMSIAFCFLECGSMFEKSGGPYLYAQKAFGNFVGYEVGMMKWIVSIIAWATMAVGFMTALSVIVPACADPTVQKIGAAALILLLSCVNLFGINIMKYLNNLTTVAKLVPLVFLVVVGIFFMKGSNFVPVFPNGMSSTTLSAAIITVFYAFTGFENVGVAAADMENPSRNVPKAIIYSISAVSVIYVMIQLVCVGILGEDLSGTAAPVTDAISRFMGTKGGLIVTVGTMISILGINIGSSFNTPRCLDGLVADGYFPDVFKKKNSKDVAFVSVIVTGVLAILLTTTGSFEQLAAISVISRFSQYIPTCIAVPILRKKHPEMKATFRVPFGIVIPAISVIASIWLIFNTEVYKIVVGLGAMVIIAPLYLLAKRSSTQKVKTVAGVAVEN